MSSTGAIMMSGLKRYFLLGAMVLITADFQVNARARDHLANFDGVVTKAMSESKIPGASVAIVREGKVIYAKGFGYRNLDKKSPVTTETLFAIGSITKSFTALAFGILCDEGKVDWNQPVRNYLPTFQLDDPIATDHATARDLFSHRTGLPGHDLIWSSSDFSRDDLFNRLRYLKFNKEFRSGYQYNNLMVMAMGYLEARVSGMSWEELVRSRILLPIGMLGANFSVRDSQRAADFAEPYELKKDVVTRVPFKNIDAIGPAGSINAGINDMSHYLILQLGDGSYGGRQIVSQSNLALPHAGLTPMGALPAFFVQQGIGPMTYGLGWVDTTYRGHHMVWHNGGIDGFHSLLVMLPEDKTGIVILSNLGENMALEPIAYSALDQLLGLPRIPWMQRFNEIREGIKEERKPKKAPTVPVVQPAGPPSHPLSDFTGSFENAGYGTIRIAQRDGTLQLVLNQMAPTALVHSRYDIFQVPLSVESDLAGLRAQFFMSAEGGIDRLAIPLERTLPEDIIFRRVAEKSPADTGLSGGAPAPSPVRWDDLIGEYGTEQEKVYILEKEGKLHALIGSHDSVPLAERSPDSFQFSDDDHHGKRVNFIRDAEGRVTEVMIDTARLARRPLGTIEGGVFRLVPRIPIADLRRTALATTPPTESGELLAPDLVDLSTLDPSIHLDIRYASKNNLMGEPVYSQAKAYLQRPAAEALWRAGQRLRAQGFGLLIHDAYRPWFVTKMFWDATPEDEHRFVADPKVGSQHNRGCAVDISLYDLETGEPVQMTGVYDEMSDRSHPFYPGGTSRQRWARDQLREAMQAQGFAVYEFEWWHFDYERWRQYPVLNVAFEDLSPPS